MQCFLCMTYVIFFCNALPAKDVGLNDQHERRSLFRDVIESLRIRAQIPEDFNQNDENNLAQNYERYGYENEPSEQLPSDSAFIPRRNDRIEMPSLKYRYPKSLTYKNESKNLETTDSPKEEIVVFITTKEPNTSTPKPKKPQKRPRPPVSYQNKEEEINDDLDDAAAENTSSSPDMPVTNTMFGQSQIGNRESQVVIKPTVIVNLRGSVNHRDSDIRLIGRKTDDKVSKNDPQNVFNIRQEVNLDRAIPGMGSRGGPKKSISGDVKESVTVEGKADDGDMMMCESGTWSSDTPHVRDSRKFDNVLQILFTV